MQQQFNCPSCGAAISFQSAISVTCICSFCRSVVVRTSTNVEAIGTMAELPPDITPFQIGTVGVHRGAHFTLIGRVRVGWEDGSWNEWCMLRDDGSRAWLAEAQGALVINAEVPEKAIPLIAPELNSIVKLEGLSYRVTDVKETTLIASEGELPFLVKPGRKAVTADLTGPKNAFAGIEYTTGELPRLYIGEYVSFNSLQFSNLRELPGWDAPRSAGKAGA